MKATLQLEQLTCPSCIAKIEKAVGKQKGVEEVKVLFNASKVKVEFNEQLIEKTSIKNLIEKLGYRVLK